MIIRGWVYIITNKAMPGLLKVGYSTKDPELRAKELYNTGSPHRYKVAYDALVNEPKSIEKQIHRALSDKKEGKEWFRCEIVDAISVIHKLIGNNIIAEKYNNHTLKNHILCSKQNCKIPAIKEQVEGHFFCPKHAAEYKNSQHNIEILKQEILNGIKVSNRKHFENSTFALFYTYKHASCGQLFHNRDGRFKFRDDLKLHKEFEPKKLLCPRCIKEMDATDFEVWESEGSGMKKIVEETPIDRLDEVFKKLTNEP